MVLTADLKHGVLIGSYFAMWNVGGRAQREKVGGLLS
jgi:hypothetical protein